MESEINKAIRELLERVGINGEKIFIGDETRQLNLIGALKEIAEKYKNGEIKQGNDNQDNEPEIDLLDKEHHNIIKEGEGKE